MRKKDQMKLENLKNLFQSAIKLDEQPKKKFYFTPIAAHQSEALEAKIKKTFLALIHAIENNESKGRLEMLQDKFEGLPIMTRELTKNDRLVYTEKDGIVKIISLKGHYKQ